MRVKAYAAMLVILGSGLLAGFFAGQFYNEYRVHQMMREGPGRLEGMMMARLSERLQLTTDQQQPVQDKVRQLTADFEKAFDSQRKVMDERSGRLLTEIRPLLNPEQQKILDGMTVEDLKPRPPPRMPPPPPGNPHGER